MQVIPNGVDLSALDPWKITPGIRRWSSFAGRLCLKKTAASCAQPFLNCATCPGAAPCLATGLWGRGGKGDRTAGLRERFILRAGLNRMMSRLVRRSGYSVMRLVQRASGGRRSGAGRWVSRGRWAGGRLCRPGRAGRQRLACSTPTNRNCRRCFAALLADPRELLAQREASRRLEDGLTKQIARSIAAVAPP